MFKLFRKYNKYILVVGMSLLMISFLIQGTVDMFIGRPADQPIGHIADRPITQTELYNAGGEMEMLQQVGLRVEVDDPLQWLLMKYEAAALGLSVSEQEVQDIIVSLGEPRITEYARRRKITVEQVRHAIYNWLTMQRYSGLMYGLGRGLPRLSERLLRHFIHDLSTTVKISGVMINATEYLDKIEPPDETVLAEHFEKYKDLLPQSSDPYGFGYRYPDRVKLEYLQLPSEMLMKIAGDKIREADIIEEFDATEQKYRQRERGASEPGAEDSEKAEPQLSKQQLYEKYRQEIKLELQRRAADRLGRDILKAASNLLASHRRGLKKTDDAYYDLAPAAAENWQPLLFEDVQAHIQSKFAVLPKVYRLEKRWRDRDAVKALPGIGGSYLLDGQEGFADYAFTTRQLQPDQNDRLTTLRLQVGITSKPMVDTGLFGSNFYLFRMIDAEAEHSPDSLEAVRAQVLMDVRREAAYKLLLADTDKWLADTREKTLELLSKQISALIRRPPAFPRRRQNFLGQLAVPDVAGIGRDAKFVNAVFALAERVADAGGIEAVEPAQRIDAVPVDRDLNLAIVRIDEYKPVTRSQYQQAAQDPRITAMIGLSMMRDVAQGPLALELLEKRVGFVDADAGENTQPSP